MIYEDVADDDLFQPVLNRLIDHRNMEIYEHLESEVFNAERGELFRLLAATFGVRGG